MIDTNSQLIVVDVREENQGGTPFAEPSGFCYTGATNPPPPGHIPGARNYPWMTNYLQNHFSELLPFNKTILLVCHAGGRSEAAAQFLCAQGFSSIYNMTGGMLAWTYQTELCCGSDAECNDGLFCTGEETCESLECVHSGDPCGDYQRCDEAADQCIDCPGDFDCDNATDAQDNCMEIPNGLWLGTCTYVTSGIVKARNGSECFSDSDCQPGDVCSKNQEDCNFNNIGNVCECYADATNDGKVNLTDLGKLKSEFGRTNCSESPVCLADSNNDDKVNLTDMSLLKADFGRSGCPIIP